MKSPQGHVVLILTLAFTSSIHGRSRPGLTRTQALRQLVSYQGSVQRLDATFPQAVTNTPPLTSMGPTSVSQGCFSGWRTAMNKLRQEGYLTSFRDADNQAALAAADLTVKGKAIFAHLTAGSIYCTVRLIPRLDAADMQIGDIQLSADGKRAKTEFRAKPSEPFWIMRRNGLFADGCGAELSPAVAIEEEHVSGHAHFRFRKGRWQAERVLLGEHLADEE